MRSAICVSGHFADLRTRNCELLLDRARPLISALGKSPTMRWRSCRRLMAVTMIFESVRHAVELELADEVEPLSAFQISTVCQLTSWQMPLVAFASASRLLASRHGDCHCSIQ